MKADYRYNPFTDKAEPVIKSELVKVPEVSPYIVRLEEVPQKTAPSSMRVAEVVIDESGTHEGSIFTEVAAFPASGEFFPDYYTSAEGDSSWNTGQILFNESEAGKMLRVNYYGMGSIIWASDTAKDTEWYRDYGNGDDGEFAPEADVTISGVKNYTSVFVPQGVTVTIDKWAARYIARKGLLIMALLQPVVKVERAVDITVGAVGPTPDIQERRACFCWRYGWQ